MTDDEADDIRDLLADNRISYYETPAGGWGISAPIFWLNDETDKQRADAILAVYQTQRGERIRQEYADKKNQGEHETIWKQALHHPLRFIVYIGFAVFIVYVSTIPFLFSGQ